MSKYTFSPRAYGMGQWQGYIHKDGENTNAWLHLTDNNQMKIGMKEVYQLTVKEISDLLNQMTKEDPNIADRKLELVVDR